MARGQLLAYLNPVLRPEFGQANGESQEKRQVRRVVDRDDMRQLGFFSTPGTNLITE